MAATDETSEVAGEDGAPGPMAGGTMGRFTVDGVIGTGGIGIVLAGRDPELDRKVAIKVLRARGGEARGRLAREAQAMARVTHPNTVAVYEVGRAGDELFIAMEFVDGATLRGWLDERPRSWRDIVAMFVAAGRGLVAIHAAGLVHRDFKVDNVMVRADGRPQVGDFGLAAAGVAPDAGELATAALGASLTLRGHAVGTPSVMAPEQWRGETVDARSDQFAFAVALWTALFRAPPYDGDDAAGVRLAVLADRRRAHPPQGAVPSTIVAALDRALGHDPASRWPELAALLRRLEHALGGRRRLVITGAIGGAVVGAAAIAALLGVRSVHPDDPCPAPTAQLGAVWSDAHARALREHLAAIDPDQGAARFAAAVRTVEPFVAGWRAMRIETCRATRVEGAQSAPLLDLRIRCLDQRLAELDGSLGLVRGTTAPGPADDALRGLLGLTPVSACRDDAALTRLLALPTGPAARAAVVAVQDRVRAIDLAYRANQMTGLLDRSTTLVADARALGHGPTLVLALSSLSDVTNAALQRDDNIALLRELTQAAAAAHDDRMEATAWVRLISAQGRDHADAALALEPAATAAVLRAGDPVDLRVQLLRVEAEVLVHGAGAAQAVDKLVESRRLLEAIPDRTAALELLRGSIVFQQGTAASALHDQAASVARYREAIDIFRGQLGPDSMFEARTLHNISDSYALDRRTDDAVAAIREATRIDRSRLGDSARVASDLWLAAMLLDNTGKYDEAIAGYRDAIAMFRAHTKPGDLAPAEALVGLADALGHAGRVAEAEQTGDEVIALYERAKSKNVNLPIAVFNRAELARKDDRCTDALPQYRRATASFEELKGPTTTFLMYPLTGEGTCLVTLGQAALAVPLLERAVTLRGDGRDVLPSAMALEWLGRALVESRRDRKRGLALAHEARTAIAAAVDPAAPAELAQLDRWLATQR